ncbi:MAG: thioredoxin family protein [Planctomycetota bacterium]
MEPTTTPTRDPVALRTRLLRWAAIVVVALTAAAGLDLIRQAVATDRVAWREMPPGPIDAAAVPVSAAPVDRPRLVSFTADWCGACRSMKADVFARQGIADAIHDRFDPYAVDLSRQDTQARAVARRYGVTHLPTLLVVGADGRELARLDRYADPEAFTSWLDDGWRRWAESRAAARPTADSRL